MNEKTPKMAKNGSGVEKEKEKEENGQNLNRVSLTAKISIK